MAKLLFTYLTLAWKRFNKAPTTKRARYLRAIRNCGILFFGVALIYGILLFNPQIFFSHKIRYKKFTIYSTQEITQKIYPILERAERLLQTSELYDPELTHSVFFCNNLWLYTFFCPPIRNAFACNFPITECIFLADTDIESDVAKCNRTRNNRKTLSGTIAHEVVHSLIKEQVGFFKNYRLLPWKKEGYCDFIAQDSSFNRELGLKMLKTGKTENSNSFLYFRFRLWIQYLIIEQKMTYKEILAQDFDLKQLHQKMLANLRNS